MNIKQHFTLWMLSIVCVYVETTQKTNSTCRFNSFSVLIPKYIHRYFNSLVDGLWYTLSQIIYILFCTVCYRFHLFSCANENFHIQSFSPESVCLVDIFLIPLILHIQFVVMLLLCIFFFLYLPLLHSISQS